MGCVFDYWPVKCYSSRIEKSSVTSKNPTCPSNTICIYIKSIYKTVSCSSSRPLIRTIDIVWTIDNCMCFASCSLGNQFQRKVKLAVNIRQRKHFIWLNPQWGCTSTFTRQSWMKTEQKPSKVLWSMFGTCFRLHQVSVKCGDSQHCCRITVSLGCVSMVTWVTKNAAEFHSLPMNQCCLSALNTVPRNVA